MQEPLLNEQYWDSRWQQSATGWDIGYASPALIEFAQTLPNKNLAILIPGCGNAYEAEALAALGFSNITLLDIAPTLVAQVQKKYQDHPSIKVIGGDFFRHQTAYNLILEQTFFCALTPALRHDYVVQMHQLLNENGQLAGLLFASEFEQEGPPFGATQNIYERLFSPLFEIKTMEPCANSIPQRSGNELFFLMEKK